MGGFVPGFCFFVSFRGGGGGEGLFYFYFFVPLKALHVPTFIKKKTLLTRTSLN